MEKESTLARREAMQAMVGATVAAMVQASAFSKHANKGTAMPWPEEAPGNPERLQAFSDN